jgi:hypothetical protein
MVNHPTIISARRRLLVHEGSGKLMTTEQEHAGPPLVEMSFQIERHDWVISFESRPSNEPKAPSA